jgi:diaminobutyrate-2-oxoglutarate transaminase
VQFSAKHESNARTYVRRFPITVKSAKGCIVTDTDGKQYYDALNVAGTLALGHNHDVVVDAAKRFLESGAPFQVLDMATPEKHAYMESLFSVLPSELSKLHFCSPAGTDVLDAAVKLCKLATGRKSVMVFHGSYHGHGTGTLAMMGNLSTKSSVPGLMPDVHFLPYPYSFRNPFGIEGEEGEKAVLKYIESVFSDAESGIPKPACVVLEAIQGEGGCGSFSPWALQQLRRITQSHNVPLILDEVQAGFCRSGDFWAFENRGSGIVPDVVCMSKAAGGSMPMAVMAYREDLDVWPAGSHTGTFRGNQIAFACGKAQTDFLRDNRMWEVAATKGARLRQHLEAIKAECPTIVDIRGRGLMLGVEFAKRDEVDHLGLPAPDGVLASEIQRQAFRRGLIQERGGRDGAVMRFLCPLIMSDDEIDAIASLFRDAVQAAQTSLKRV